MICKPMKIIDKTGYEVILRNAEINDAEDLIKYLKITTSEIALLWVLANIGDTNIGVVLQ